MKLCVCIQNKDCVLLFTLVEGTHIIPKNWAIIIQFTDQLGVLKGQQDDWDTTIQMILQKFIYDLQIIHILGYMT